MTKTPTHWCALVVSLLLTITSVSRGQSTGPVEAGLVAIDGAKNPTAIPDGTAFSLLFLSLLPSHSELPAQYQKRLASRIAAIGLTVDQGQNLLAAATQYEAAVMAQDSRTEYARSIKPVPLTTRLQWRAERDNIANVIALDLQQQLGPDASTKLLTHLATSVKPHIKTVIGAN